MKKNGKLYNFLKSDYKFLKINIFFKLHHLNIYNFRKQIIIFLKNSNFLFFYENFNFKKKFIFFPKVIFRNLRIYIILKKVILF